MKAAILGVLFLLLAAGCATAPKQARHSSPEEGISQDHFSEIEAKPVPLVMNDRVQDWINYFQGAGRERFELYLQRSAKYIPMIKRILRQYGLPEDLVYLAMIESGFNPHAYSRARATGTWQFIYRTGVRYGLRADNWIDERRDPEKSTIAAAKYLKDLYDQFNDWYLAAAGYNAGEGKIHRAIRKYRTEDFWEMSRQRYLRRETKDYVPKMIAAALISKNPGRYGFPHVRYEEPVPFEEVAIETPIDLRVAAQCAEASYEEIKGLNPELLHWVTPPDYPGYRLKVPAGSAERFQLRYALLSPEERIAEKIYTVKKGESFALIAKQHGFPVKFLAALNGAVPHQALKAGQPVLIPHQPPEGERFRERTFERQRRRRSVAGGGGNLLYSVRRGDNLTRISRRLGVRASRLQNLNPEIEWASLKYGTRIRLVTGGTGGPRSVAVVPSPELSGEFTAHVIQSGETLWEIAKRYHVSIEDLKRWNGITHHRRIRPGQTLKVKVPTVASATEA